MHKLYNCIIFCLIILTTISCGIAHAADCIFNNRNICEIAKQTANELNASLPKTLGNITYISVTTDQNQIIHSYDVSYGLEQAAKSTNSTTDEIKIIQEKMVRTTACDDQIIRKLFYYGIFITYIYTFKDGMVNKFTLTNCLK